MRKSAIVIGILAAFLFAGCSGGGFVNSVTVETVLKPGLSGEDVYFIFTNPDPENSAQGVPDVHYSTTGEDGRVATGRGSARTAIPGQPAGAVLDPRLWQLPEGVSPETPMGRATGISAAYTPPSDSVGGTPVEFFVVADGDPSTVSATCRYLGTFDEDIADPGEGGKTLAIFVENSQWGSVVDNGDVTELANRFQVDESEEDIWGWVTDILGEPWGEHEFGNLLDPGAEDYITILLYDISRDGTTALQYGGIVGYFAPGNNFTDYSLSNERLMFAIDAPMLGDDNADRGDYWPLTVYSTLAHEFQHMIHFYQKQIVYNANSSDTWMNEMCSLVTEDLLNDKIGVPGPRGIDPADDDGDAGTRSICDSSRLSYYNYWPEASLTKWGGTNGDALISYAAAYSFGAYLARNYGGAALFRSIVQNRYLDERAVLSALSDLGHNASDDPDDFEDLLIEWAKATILSDDEATSDKTFNKGDFWYSSASSPTGTDYTLGSIDLYNYEAYYWVGDTKRSEGYGPFFYGDGGYTPGRPGPASNTVFLAAENFTGDLEMEVELPAGSTLTVVTKPHD